MEKLFRWMRTPSSEEGDGGRERELRPLTEGEVVSYGSNGNSHGVVAEEYVVVSSSEGEGSQQCSCEHSDTSQPESPSASCGSSGRSQPESPSASRGGILKTAHFSKSTSCPHRKEYAVEWRSRADMPVRMKGLQATLHRGHVFIGGGYTGHAQTEMTVYGYDPNFDLWTELPISPMRWFGITEFKGQLVLVGGKDVEAGRRLKLTNRIAVYSDIDCKWVHPYPPMSAARSHPLVFSHTHLLVVAGGRKGVLDFNVEVFNGLHWCQAASLPTPVSPLTSHIHNGHWYLLGGVAYTAIHHKAVEDYLSPVLEAAEGGEDGGEASHSSGDSGWEKLAPPPFLATRIMSVGRHVTVFPSSPVGSEGASVQIHLFLGETEGWIHAGRVPHVCGSATGVCLPRGELLLLGGDVDGIHYSNKVYIVTAGSTGVQRKKTKFAALPSVT